MINMSGLIKLCFLLALVAVVANSQQLKKRAIDSSPGKLQLADDVIEKDRLSRQTNNKAKPKPTQRPLGFFGTIKNLIFNQINDTRSAYSQLSDLFGNQFSDSPRKSTTPPPITDNTTTTTPEPPRISRAEFLNILRRNLIGLRNLYQLEVREAISDSAKNIADYQREFRQKVYEQFED